MNRRFFFTPSFCKWQLLKDFLEHHYSMEHPKDLIHVIIDNHYPIDKANNHDKIKRLANQYNCVYVDSGKDLGLHEGLNNAIKVLKVDENDFLCGNDADDRPESLDFIEAAYQVMKNSSFAIVALHNYLSRQREEEDVFLDREIEVMGETVLVHPNCEMVNIAAYNLKWIKSIGGFQESLPYYGTMERTLYRKFCGLPSPEHFIGYLKNHKAITLDKNNPQFFDSEYSGWKLDHVQGIWKGDFESWLINWGKRDLIG